MNNFIDKTSVWITTRFEGFHKWEDAPDEVAFLRDYHRHLFHVWLEKSVNSLDRELEFFALKRKVDAYITETYSGKRFSLSCEQIAWDLLNWFDAHSVVVSEDGENGATAVREKLSLVASTGREPWEARAGETSWGAVGGKDSPAPAQLPSQQLRTKCFVGKEAEGPNRGKYTLFVPGCVTLSDYETAINRLTERGKWPLIEQVYLGAGNSLWDSMSLLQRVRRDFDDNAIAVEVGDRTLERGEVADLSKHTKICFISRNLQDWSRLGAGVVLKVFRPGMVHWIVKGTGFVYSTRLDDELFSQDEEV